MNKVAESKERKSDLADRPSRQTLQTSVNTQPPQVSDIKRINHIWNGNELSARVSVLIPVAKHSQLLQEPSPPSEEPTKPPEVQNITTISIKTLSSHNTNTNAFIEQMNADIETLLKETQIKTMKSSLSEVKSALTVERIFPKQISHTRSDVTYWTLGKICIGFTGIFIVFPFLLVYWNEIV